MEIRAKSSSKEEKGCFDYGGTWSQTDTVLSVTFVPTIFLNKALDAAELHHVKEHEERHFRDFKRQADKLKNALDQTIKRQEDAEIDARMAWFEYDVVQDWNAFHRTTGRTVKIVFPPSVPRPK